MLPQLDITSGAENGHVNPAVFFLVGIIHYFSLYRRIAVVKFLGLYQGFIAPTGRRQDQRTARSEYTHRGYRQIQTNSNAAIVRNHMQSIKRGDMKTMYTSKARKNQYDTANMLLGLRNMNLSMRGRPVEQFNDRVKIDLHIRELKTVKCAICGDVSADDDEAKRRKEFCLMRSCY